MLITYVAYRQLVNLGGEILEDASTVDCRGTSNSPQPLFTLHLDIDCWSLQAGARVIIRKYAIMNFLW